VLLLLRHERLTHLKEPMMSRNPWYAASWDMWRLGMEVSTVIALRSWKMAAGGAAAKAEAKRMVAEKIDAGMALQAKAATGGLGLSAPGAVKKTVAHYRRKVRANKRRLAK
jgi:hypothetical protein